MTRRFWQALVCGALAASVAAPLALAQEKSAESAARGSDRPNVRAATTRIPADAPGVRLAGLIRNDGVVLRNKGIASVTKPASGIFCIKPAAATGITPNNAIPQLTIDWARTQFNEAMAQWADVPQFCAANQIEVHTVMDFNLTARYSPSNTVSFSIIVP